MRRWEEGNTGVKMIAAVITNNIIFWELRSCSLVENYRRELLILFPNKRQKNTSFRTSVISIKIHGVTSQNMTLLNKKTDHK